MAVSLSISRIGVDEAPAYAEFGDAALAYGWLANRHGVEQLRGDVPGEFDSHASGTIGSLNGRVFQASSVFVIRPLPAVF